MLMIDEEDFDKICCHYCILHIEAVCDYKKKKIVCPTVNRMKEKSITFSDDEILSDKEFEDFKYVIRTQDFFPHNVKIMNKAIKLIEKLKRRGK